MSKDIRSKHVKYWSILKTLTLAGWLIPSLFFLSSPASAQTELDKVGIETSAMGSPGAKPVIETLDQGQLFANKIFEQIEKCAGFSRGGARLLCYDQLSITYGIYPEDQYKEKTEIIDKYGLWEGSRKISSTGEERYFFKVFPTAPLPERVSVINQPELVVSCSYGQTNFYLDWKETFASPRNENNIVIMEYRADSPNAVAERWNLSTDRMGAYSPSAIDFLKKIRTKNKLHMRFPTEKRGVRALLFELEGLDNVLNSVVENCYR